MRALLILGWMAARLGAQASPAELPLYARDAALGGACGACGGSVQSLSENPAGILGRSVELSAASLSWAEGIQLYGAQLLLGAPTAAFAVGIQGFGIEDQARDGIGQPAGRFKYGEQVLSVGLATGDAGFAWGLAWQVEGQAQSELSQAYAGDAGVQGALPLKGLRYGLSLRGLSAGGRTPANCYLCLPEFALDQPVYGAALAWQKPGSPWRFLGGYDYDNARYANALHLGLEQAGRFAADKGWDLRLGWRSDQSSLGDMAGFSAGLGLEWSDYAFDYAFSTLGDFGLAHRVALSYRRSP